MVVFLISLITFFIVYLITPYIIYLSNKKNIHDIPDHRKKHISPIPRLGGLAIFIGLIVGSLFLIIFNKNDFINTNNSNILFYLSCYFLIFILGFIDDLKPISPFLRLSFQFLIASISWASIVRINGIFITTSQINNYFSIESDLLTYLLTVIWIVGVINAINWVDGIDGLLIGLTSIYSITFSILSFANNNSLEGYISLLMFFSCLGILRYNKSPAKIMLGDGGSYLIGFYLSNSALTYGELSGVINPFLTISLLLLPIMDMIRVLVKRLLTKGKSPFYPDRTHLHYLLIDNGMPLTRYLNIIFSISISISILNIIIQLKS